MSVIAMDWIRRCRRETSSRSCPRSQEADMSDRVVLMIGTKKGVFVAEAPAARRRFTLRGPFGAGVGVNATLVDTRGATRLYASSCNPFFGMKVLRSSDLGKSFKETKS